jgi:soluble lytic murein transglycosylase
LSVVLLLTPFPLGAKKKKDDARAVDDLRVYESLVRRDGLESLPPSPLWDPWRTALLARAFLERDDPQKALDGLKNLPLPPEEILNRNQDFYRRLYRDALETGLAAARRLSGETEDWERKLWTYFPDFGDPASEKAPAGIRTEDRVRRLHLLSQKSLFETVPDLLTPAEIAGAGVSPDDKCRALFEWAWALQKLKRKEEAAEGYERVEGVSCDAKIRARALYWKGLMEYDLKRYEAAEATFRRLAKLPGDTRYADDAHDRLAKIHDAQNDRDKAERALRDLAELPEGDLKEKYLWERAFEAYRDADYDRALDSLDRLAETRDLGTEARPQALYWKARIVEIRSKKRLGGSSSGGYRQVLKAYPFSFYALLAEARLGGAASVPSVAKLGSSPSDGGPFASALRVVDKLADRKARAAAADLLDYLTYVDPSAAGQDPQAVAALWIEAGDYNRALELAAGSLDRSVFDINLDPENPLTRALYPAAYPEEVKEAASVNRLPQALILGIMREESLFERGARSRAGALGLMQLMPATARIKAKKLGIPYSSGELKDPAYNIRLGSSFLRDLMNRFGERTPLAVMGYNAGPGNVSKWLGAQGYLPLDEFIESIPFTETRGYVKRVLRSAHIYGHLQGRAKRTDLVPSMDAPQ